MIATTMEKEGAALNVSQQEKPREALIRTDDLWKTYVMGDEEIHALRGVSFEIRRNEYVAIIGPSGSGKSTLMNLIGCLDTPSKGEYWLNNKLVSQMDDGRGIEIATIGNEGMAGLPVFLQATQTSAHVAFFTRTTVGAVHGRATVPAWAAQRHTLERGKSRLTPQRRYRGALGFTREIPRSG